MSTVLIIYGIFIFYRIMNGFDIVASAPIVFLTGIALLVLLLEALLRKSEPVSYFVSILGLIITAVLSFLRIGNEGTAFNNMITTGGYGCFFSALFATAALLTVMISRDYIRKEQVAFGEFYLLILLATVGMMLMASAADLIVVFLGLELMSICLYTLAGFLRSKSRSNESSLKYFLLGAFASGFLLYGIALIYGAAETTNIPEIVSGFHILSGSAYFWIGIGLLCIGLAFKVGAVPFHMWVPDVYQGSPTPVSGFMATGAKAAAFATFVLIFSHHPDAGPKLKTVLSVVSAASMILGNIVAISQTNLKRMLAYSSIAHAGYMLAGLAAGNALGRSGIMFYLVTYTFMNIGAFGVLSLIENGEKNLTYDDYKGLASKNPILAAMMAVFMFSLAGIPPFAGFFGKYYVFVAAISSDLTWLAILGVITSLISVYYYLRLVVVMYFQEGEVAIPSYSGISIVVLVVAIIAIVGLGIYPSSILSIITSIK
jgi:NADH-quinone oxidoreductase subunit N